MQIKEKYFQTYAFCRADFVCLGINLQKTENTTGRNKTEGSKAARIRREMLCRYGLWTIET